jgi:hypothetical protein
MVQLSDLLRVGSLGFHSVPQSNELTLSGSARSVAFSDSVGMARCNCIDHHIVLVTSRCALTSIRG